MARIPKTLDREIEIWCAAAGWTKQRFIETAARELLTKLTGKRKEWSR